MQVVQAKSEINKLGVDYDINWISQVVSSLSFTTVCHGKCFMESWHNSKYFWQYFWFFVCDFLYQTVMILWDQNVLIES